MKPELLLILNPAAGHGRSRGVLERLLAVLARLEVARPVIWQTAGPGHGSELAARAAREGYTRIVAVGGDGTVHEAVNGLMSLDPGLLAGVRLGVVPAGSGNDFARNLGLPRSLEELARLLVSGEASSMDLGWVNGHYFANVAGVGFDAEVAMMANRMPKVAPGSLIYLASAVATLARYRNARLTVRLDGRELDGPALLVAVGNGARYGGGLMICPGARMEDGLFRVVVVGDLSRGEVLQLMPRLYSGGHLRHPRVTTYDAQQIAIASDRPLAVHADGEAVGRTPATVRMVRAALQVIGMARPAVPAATPSGAGGMDRRQPEAHAWPEGKGASAPPPGSWPA